MDNESLPYKEQHSDGFEDSSFQLGSPSKKKTAKKKCVHKETEPIAPSITSCSRIVPSLYLNFFALLHDHTNAMSCLSSTEDKFVAAVTQRYDVITGSATQH